MNTTQEIKITSINHEETGWKRRIHFQYEGKDYQITLYWDEFDGYDIVWRFCNGEQISRSPEWAINWNEDEHEGMSFEHYLDELTWENK
jgi:hypothetical protein